MNLPSLAFQNWDYNTYKLLPLKYFIFFKQKDPFSENMRIRLYQLFLFLFPFISSKAQIYDKLVWSDEFDYYGPVSDAKWFHQTLLPIAGGWYNGEQQHYTNRIDNSYVSSSTLKIVAKKESFTDQNVTKSYTSARLNSKFKFKYGRIEFRAKLPSGVGTWPALWMLGSNIDENGAFWDNQGLGTTPWPACGEIDIMEHWGSNQNYVQSAIHTPSSYGATVNLGGQIIPTASNDFHVYALEWSPEKLVFSVDSVVHYTYNPAVKNSSNWPFDADQYLLLNIAIQQNISASFLQSTLEIDYVRIYQEKANQITIIEQSNKDLYFPNPVTNQLNIILNNTFQQQVSVSIYASNGELIKSENLKLNNNIICLDNLAYLSKGLYYISYELNNQSYGFKMVKD